MQQRLGKKRRLENLELYRKRDKERYRKNPHRNDKYAKSKSEQKKRRLENDSEYHEKRYARLREKILAYQKKIYLAAPEKFKARKKINKAIATKKMKRPSKCEICLKQCKPDAHHDDYSKPLEVRWLCKRCHFKHHKQM